MTTTCTCSPSIIDPGCPMAEHRMRAEMAGLRLAGSRSGAPFDVKVMDLDPANPHLIECVIALRLPAPVAEDPKGGGYR